MSGIGETRKLLRKSAPCVFCSLSAQISLKLKNISTLMRRSNRNFNIPPPPPGKPRAFDYFLCPGVGNLTGPSRGWGIWPCLGTGSVRFQIAFFLAGGAEVANSYKHVFGRNGALQEKLTRKGLQTWECLNILNYFYRLYINDVDFLYNESSCGFVPQWIVKEINTVEWKTALA